MDKKRFTLTLTISITISNWVILNNQELQKYRNSLIILVTEVGFELKANSPGDGYFLSMFDTGN